MLFMVVGDSAWRRRYGETRIAALFLGNLNAAFDFPYRIQIIGHAISIVRTKSALQPPDLAADRVENAALCFDALDSLLCGGAIPEHPVKHHPRIDFHWHGY